MAKSVPSTVGAGPSRAWHICGEGKDCQGVCEGGRFMEGGGREEEGRNPKGWVCLLDGYPRAALESRG